MTTENNNNNNSNKYYNLDSGMDNYKSQPLNEICLPGRIQLGHAQWPQVNLITYRFTNI